jgi:hypothetical protein
MRAIAAAIILLLAGQATAQDEDGYTLKIFIPTGPGLTRLSQLCDWLRADPQLRKPEMTNDECGERFFLRGAHGYNHDRKLAELRSQGNAILKLEDAQFWVDLPMPSPGPTPSPSPTPSPTPTPTPTMEP